MQEIDEYIVFDLPKSERSYWRRVRKMWMRYNLLLLILIIATLLLHGYDKLVLFLYGILSLLGFLYSCYKKRQVLLSLTHQIKPDTIEVIILRYNSQKRLLLSLRKDVKIHVRKLYQYRYPIDGLLILYKNKEIYVQEEVHPGWTAERFSEIERYFKTLQKSIV